MTIAEHTFDELLLPEKANILDLGCRGFAFANPLILADFRVITVDMDKTVFPGSGVGWSHYTCAVTNYDGWCGIINDRDPQATRFTFGDNTPCYTLETLSGFCSVDFWDLIKMDIEGSEYEVIMSLDVAPAKQLSIEFHLHTGIYKQDQVDEMVSKLTSLGYEVRQHELTDRHCAGFNYWDSLFILS